jgi:hypothetical protein
MREFERTEVASGHQMLDLLLEEFRETAQRVNDRVNLLEERLMWLRKEIESDLRPH